MSFGIFGVFVGSNLTNEPSNLWIIRKASTISICILTVKTPHYKAFMLLWKEIYLTTQESKSYHFSKIVLLSYMFWPVIIEETREFDTNLSKTYHEKAPFWSILSSL